MHHVRECFPLLVDVFITIYKPGFCMLWVSTMTLCGRLFICSWMTWFKPAHRESQFSWRSRLLKRRWMTQLWEINKHHMRQWTTRMVEVNNNHKWWWMTQWWMILAWEDINKRCHRRWWMTQWWWEPSSPGKWWMTWERESHSSLSFTRCSRCGQLSKITFLCPGILSKLVSHGLPLRMCNHFLCYVYGMLLEQLGPDSEIVFL